MMAGCRPRSSRGEGPVRWGLVALLTLAAGCAAHPHRALQTAVALDQERRAIRVPASLRGGRGPVLAVRAVVERKPTSTAPSAGDGEAPPRSAEGTGEEAPAEPLPFPAERIAEEVPAALQSSGAFEAVFPVGRGRPGATLPELAEEARRHGASFLLDARVLDPRLTRRNVDVFLPVTAWLFLGFPSFWFHNHTYQLDFDTSLRLYDLNRETWFPAPAAPPVRYEEALNFHERTSSPWTYLLSNVFPSPFCPVDGDKIARTLAVKALQPPLEGFLARVAGELKGERYRFTVQTRAGAGAVHVRYPPANRPVYLLQHRARVVFDVSALPGRTLRKVWLGDRLVFPVRAARTHRRWPRRRSLRLVTLQDTAAPALLRARDSAGAESTCLVVGRAVTGGGSTPAASPE